MDHRQLGRALKSRETKVHGVECALQPACSAFGGHCEAGGASFFDKSRCLLGETLYSNYVGLQTSLRPMLRDKNCACKRLMYIIRKGLET